MGADNVPFEEEFQRERGRERVKKKGDFQKNSSTILVC